ncbi:MULTISPECIES: helix-turn-helix transcriptional regulator [Paenibacillus]|uniref:Putative DNA-binding transcriptional regulator YafY n=1 Tax=Paenibacillus pabuli TaxID=1472 RepID=A0A855XSV0_9BACL|nr:MULTISPECIES: YafY family protein [Paenibacillus]PWW35026.1 putative DNA-binding transcriptional regulator YafY [Paenibacillus pabuli]PXW01784.1 putative DNA-binding transcriptional regulator YafY [Paenibacillus taichungensis]
MKKSERMNQMLRFINQKQHFTLQDLMQEFQISKRTALRDIASLEEIGAPLYAEYGRYGGYRLLQQMQLPPISFNTSELHALYFAMQALRSFTNLPFQVSFRSIHEKFLSALSENQRQDIEQIQHRVSFRHTEQIRDSEHLEFLLMAAVQNIVIQITYQHIRSSSSSPDNNSNPDKPKPGIRTIQPIALYAMKGYWYCQVYDLGKQAYRVFRCDRITSCEATDIEPIPHINELNLQDAHSLWKPSADAIPFKCLINEAGVELFQQEAFPSMRIINESETDTRITGYAYLVGSYEAPELEFIIRYLASFGKSIKIIEPDTLKESLKQHYLDLLGHV